MHKQPDLSTKRCFNHANRESVARCPDCARFFCRECVNDHNGRLLCADCLLEMSVSKEKQKPGILHMSLPPLRIGLGLLAAWLAFYLLATGLLTIPSTIHDGAIWHEQTTR